MSCDLDWAHLIDLAARHRVESLLFTHLESVGPGRMPRPVFMELWRRYENNARLNLERTRELLRILGLLAGHSIPALPYKGPALAQLLYGSIAMREFEDLDVLVRFEDVPRAKALLMGEGYQPDYPLAPQAEDAFLHSRHQYHRVLVHQGTGAQVELHWKTDPGFPIEASHDPSWWDSRPTMPLLDGKVRGFSREELLLVLCLHGTRHQGYRLGWLVEIAELIAAGELDWSLILATVRAKSCVRRLGVPLHLVSTLRGSHLPPEVVDIISSDRNITELSARIAGRLFARNVPELRALERLRVSLQFYDLPRQRFDHVVDVSIAPSLNEWSRWPLPPALQGLYLPLRLWRLAGKYGAALVGRN